MWWQIANFQWGEMHFIKVLNKRARVEGLGTSGKCAVSYGIGIHASLVEVKDPRFPLYLFRHMQW